MKILSLQNAKWTQYGDQPLTFPTYQPPTKKTFDPFKVKVEAVGPWRIVPVLRQEGSNFTCMLAGWAVILPGSKEQWSPATYCPTVFSSKKKARVWAEHWRLWPLTDMVPMLDNPASVELTH